MFYLYYSVGTLHDLSFETCVATSGLPRGPYKDNGVPLKDSAGAQYRTDHDRFTE